MECGFLFQVKAIDWVIISAYNWVCVCLHSESATIQSKKPVRGWVQLQSINISIFKKGLIQVNKNKIGTFKKNNFARVKGFTSVQKIYNSTAHYYPEQLFSRTPVSTESIETISSKLLALHFTGRSFWICEFCNFNIPRETCDWHLSHSWIKFWRSYKLSCQLQKIKMLKSI